jgi:hypothetical protein
MPHHPSHPARPRDRPPAGGWQYIRRRPDASPCEPSRPAPGSPTDRRLAVHPETSGCLTVRATLTDPPRGPTVSMVPGAIRRVGSKESSVVAHLVDHPDVSPTPPSRPGRPRPTSRPIRTSPPHRRPGPADPGPPRDPSGRLPHTAVPARPTPAHLATHPDVSHDATRADAARLTGGPVELDARYRPWSSRHAPRAGAPTLRPARWRRRAPPCGRDARRRRRWR